MFCRALFLLGLSLVSGCRMTQPCFRVAQDLCDICPKDAYTEVFCDCIENGDLVLADLSDEMKADLQIETQDDASRECDWMTVQLEHPRPNDLAECKQDQEFLDTWQADACEDLGWTEDGGYWYWY